MTPKGKTQVTNSDLDKRARVLRKQLVLKNISGGIGNVQHWLEEMKKLLEEEMKENIKKEEKET